MSSGHAAIYEGEGPAQEAFRRVRRGPPKALCCRAVRWSAMLCLLAGGLLTSSAPALALSARGHEFEQAFAASGPCLLAKPGAVAVNESSEDVYVVDQTNKQIDEFSTAGECVSALKAPAGGAVVSIAVDNSSSPSAGDLYVAVSKKEETFAIYKYNSSGEKVAVLKGPRPEGTTEEFEKIHGIAVDATGKLWVDQGESIDSFSSTTPLNGFIAKIEPTLIESTEQNCELTPGFAVGPEAEVFYVNHFAFRNEECREEPPFSVLRKLNRAAASVNEELDPQNTSAVAVDLANSNEEVAERGDVFINNLTSVAEYDPEGALIQRFGSPRLKEGSGIAVDSTSGVVYVADAGTNGLDVFAPEKEGPPTVDALASRNLSPGATELIAQIDPHGSETKYYFQYGTGNCLTNPSSCTTVPIPPGVVTFKNSGGEVEAATGYGHHTVSVQLTGLQPGSTYYYRVVAKNAQGEAEGNQTLNTFTTVPSAAAVLPDNRAWELVTPVNKLGAGIKGIPTEEGSVQASEDGGGLAYVANAPLAEPEGSRSPEGTQILATRNTQGWSTQDIETPHAGAFGIHAGAGAEYRLFSTDLSLAFVEPPAQRLLAEPPLAPPQSPQEAGHQEATMYLRANQPIAPAPPEQPTYTEAKENGEKLAREHGEPEALPGYVALLTAANTPAGTKFGISGLFKSIQFQGATPELSHVAIQGAHGVVLTSEPASPRVNLYAWSRAEGKASEQLKLVSVLPEAQGPAAAPELGNLASNVRHAISSDGSRFIWGNEPGSEGGAALYLRDMSKRETIRLDAAQGTEEKTENRALFQTANSEGTRIFFTDRERLTADSTAPFTNEFFNTGGFEQRVVGDLYVFETTPGAGKLGGKLTDLTVDPHNAENGERAGVHGIVLGASEDGSAVYFVANGALAPGAAPGNCAGEAEDWSKLQGEKEKTCNLYVAHHTGEGETGKWETTFITTLSNEDAADWGEAPGASNLENLSFMTSRVSPNGRYLAFMSDRSLTGYDNKDVNSGALDEEVFLYDATAGRLVCASCNPSGAPPAGIFDSRHSNHNVGPLVDANLTWENRWLAGSIPGWTPLDGTHALYQSRYLSDAGRLFFTSADALVPQVKVTRQENGQGVENVYEYQPEGVPKGEQGECQAKSGCVALISSGTSAEESSFLDASVSGNDVFFVTSAQVLPQDQDTGYDIYDARVCTQASPCLAPPPPPAPICEAASSCRSGSASSPATPGAPASSTPSSSLPAQQTLPFTVVKPVKPRTLSSAQKRAKALKACRKIRKHKKRLACERAAKKRYPAKKAKKANRRK